MKKITVIILSLLLMLSLASCDVVAGEVDKLVNEATAPLMETIDELEATKTELENAKATLEQAKNIETKENTVVYERHGLIALVDDTASVIIGASADELNLAMTAAAGECRISVGEELGAGHTYRLGIGMDKPLKGDDLSDWPVWNGEAIEAEAGQTLMIAECDADGRCIKCGMAIAS